MSDSELIALLTEQAGRLFDDLIDRDLLAAVEHGVPAALADAVDAFGLAAALEVAEEEGGLSFADAGSLFALFGAHAVPLPIGETMLARALLARAGITAPPGDIGLSVRGGDGVAFGDRLAHIVAKRDDKLVLLPVDVQTATAGISRQPRAIVEPIAPPVAEAAWPAALPDPLTLGAILRASQIAGAIARVLALSVDYANTRQQFGRSIGKFQAVQQLLAKLAAEAAAARSAADGAWAAVDAGDPGFAPAIAKIRASEAARVVAAIAHQVHGAIGVTDEHALHYFTRRLWEWRLDFGSDSYWAAILGRAAQAAVGGLWPFLVTDCARISRKVDA